MAIDAELTGVTDGNAATNWPVCWPSAISRARAGASPDATAFSSIAGFIASMTASTSFLRAATGS